ncbi:MAG: hypothetical protein Q8861_05310 [Bacteroidota bacterium]|nr:hypothetical protein [Bacteroidota bacterium]MDP4270751.1 hypothetical protein [Bacteroidota bacterium]
MKQLVPILLIVVLSVWNIEPVASQQDQNQNRFLLWGSGGYSQITNDAPVTAPHGNVGIAIGIGYELLFNRLLVQTGIELSHYTSKMSLIDTALVVSMVDTEGTPFNGNFTFQNTEDAQQITNVGIPLMLGYESPKGFYVALGGKAMLNIVGRSKAKTYVTSTASYTDVIGDNNDGIFSDMPNHGLTMEPRTVKTSIQLHTIFAGSVEAGYTFGKKSEDFSVKNRPKIRLSMFCDYGIASVAEKDKPASLFVNTSNAGGFTPAISGYLLNDIRSNRLNILYVGLKVTVLFSPKKYGCNCAPE